MMSAFMPSFLYFVIFVSDKYNQCFFGGGGYRNIFRRELKEVGKQRPVVIHCSAGVGRTGTFIALDTIMAALSEGNFRIALNLHDVIAKMRKNRLILVQTPVSIPSS